MIKLQSYLKKEPNDIHKLYIAQNTKIILFIRFAEVELSSLHTYI